MGNRGDLHSRDGEIVRDWRRDRLAWIACTTVGRDGHRVSFDKPGRYTPLFALDEVTMLAAGHRPCPQCRYQAHIRFKAAWSRAHDVPGGRALPIAEIDEALHEARLDGAGRQRTFDARLRDLPDGVMVMPRGILNVVYLLWHGQMHAWSHDGYRKGETVVPDIPVVVLTPEPIVGVLRAGYAPVIEL